MKQFSISCDEQSIVWEGISSANMLPRMKLTFTDIPESYTFSDISWKSVFITILLDAVLILLTVKQGLESPFFLSVVSFALIGSLYTVNAMEKIIKLNFTKKGRQISRIHSAMHQAINAIIQLDNCNPDVSQIKASTRFCSSCQSIYTTESFLLSIFSIPVIIYTHRSILLCIISLIVLRIIVENLLDRGAFNFLQIFFLRKPTDQEIALVSEMLQQRKEIAEAFLSGDDE